MKVTRREFIGGAAALTLAACGTSEETETVEQDAQESEATETQESALSLDASAWSYNADDDVYYQIGISYCETPADESLETLALIVPAAYFTATDNGDGTYTCAVNEAGTVGSYSATTAPYVMPVNTPGYSAMSAMSEYQSVAAYTSQGIIYAHAGCRGRDNGAPAGVTDLKAAVRFVRTVKDLLPGDTDRFFTFGMSGGGAQSALMGATGDSVLFEPYLTAIGAAAGVSDAIYGSMDWCPITGLDVGDAAYEWMMGCTRENLSEDEQAISDGLAEAFASYVNGAGITDETGAQLVLAESEEGIYQAGSYYERVKAAVEESLEHFLADTEFPYDASSASSGMGGGSGGGMGGERPEGVDGEMPEGAMGAGPGAEAQAEGTDGVAEQGEASGEVNYEEIDNISRTETSSGLSLTGTYETAADYVEALNADGEWVTLDETTGEVTITSVADFCKALKQASKSLGAFDQLDRGQGENTLFGVDGEAAHFDAYLATVLSQIGSEYAADYEADLELTDAEGIDMATRVAMYTPLYYLLGSSEGFGTSEIAKHWRIRSGINQGDTALTTELNLALALEADARVESVDFASVWGQGHTQAERTGDSESNFISWVLSLA